MNKKLIYVLFFLVILSTFSFAILSNEAIKIFAVTEDQRGIVADLGLYTIPGSGDVAFVTSSSLVGKDTQTTGNIAVRIAENRSGVSARNNNFIFDIKANASEVDGPSAGAAMALLSYAILSERRLNQKVAITGSINSDGSVGSVGGVGPKAIAASRVGIELFMIPRGTANQPIRGDDGRTNFVNLLSYGPDELGMKIIEVSNIDEVIELAYSNLEEIDIDPDSASEAFVPKAVKYPSSLNSMKEISENYITRAREVINEAKKELETTELDDSLRNSFYPQLGISERNIEMSEIYLDQNYLYSAANYSFNARVLAGAIRDVASNPSLLTKESRVLDLKINSLQRNIDDLKSRMDFIPMNNYEWIIGAQQRIAYAENALNNIKNTRIELMELDDSIDESGIMFNIIYDYSSASAWFEVAGDFFNEARKDPVKKVPNYDNEFIENVREKINDLEILITDSNLGESQLSDPLRRFNSARISFNNEFYFASIYDVYFATSFINSELKKSDLNVDDMFDISKTNIENKNNLRSIWSHLFIDHAFFYLENAKFQLDSERMASYESNVRTSFDLSELSKNIELAKFIVEDYLISNNFEEYVSKENEVLVGITYNEREILSPILVSIVVLLFFILLIVVFVGFNKARNPFIVDVTRAEKLDLLLQRLDKALLNKKINDAEYFFLKKKYEDEFRMVSDARSQRSKIALNLGESKSKLSALQQGLKDLNKHYKAGLVIPEDYERHMLEVQTEINEVKSRIHEYEEELRASRRTNYRRAENKKANKLKGTKDIENDEKMLEEEAKTRRKKLLEKFKGKKSKK